VSMAARIVADYVEMCRNPARDWQRWIAEDRRYNPAGPRSFAQVEKRGDNNGNVHTTSASSALENAGRVRPEILHELPSGLDARGTHQRPKQDQEKSGADNLPAGSRTDHRGHDALRPVRAEGERNFTLVDHKPSKHSERRFLGRSAGRINRLRVAFKHHANAMLRRMAGSGSGERPGKINAGWPDAMRLELRGCRTQADHTAWKTKWGKVLSGEYAREKRGTARAQHRQSMFRRKRPKPQR
jgi:hypothetical protein